MSQRTVELSEEQETFVVDHVASGRYEDASAVVRAALEALEREERALDEAIAAGFASGVAEGDVFARVRERTGLPPLVRR